MRYSRSNGQHAVTLRKKIKERKFVSEKEKSPFVYIRSEVLSLLGLLSGRSLVAALVTPVGVLSRIAKVHYCTKRLLTTSDTYSVFHSPPEPPFISILIHKR